jgi:hypothetical protein|tara:strand:+ start:287 stop:523 length:237 start_codon:yes stop_codon:yes gene_type:complete
MSKFDFVPDHVWDDFNYELARTDWWGEGVHNVRACRWNVEAERKAFLDSKSQDCYGSAETKIKDKHGVVWHIGWGYGD